MKIYLILLALIPTSLMAYQPGKWYHTDPYINGNKLDGPSSIQVLDRHDQIMKTAKYEYISGGKLAREIYFDNRLRNEGETEFKYNKQGLPVSEILKNSKDQILSRREYHYQAGKLIKTSVMDETGVLVIEQTYIYRDNRIIGGIEKTGDDESKFKFIYMKNMLSSVIVLNDDGRVLSEVNYKYDSKGRLISREKKHLDSISLCKYEYNGSRLISYTYFFKSNGSMIVDKKIQLNY